MMAREVFTIHEFGNTVSFSGAGKDIADYAKGIITEDYKKVDDALNYIVDFKWVAPPEVVEGPRTDYLDRFRNYGWYARGGSVGYDALKKHFACHKRHIPYTITMDFINQMIREYAEQVKNGEENYEDYDYD